MFREFLDKGLEKGWPESLCKEQSQITLFKSPLIRSQNFRLSEFVYFVVPCFCGLRVPSYPAPQKHYIHSKVFCFTHVHVCDPPDPMQSPKFWNSRKCISKSEKCHFWSPENGPRIFGVKSGSFSAFWHYNKNNERLLKALEAKLHIPSPCLGASKNVFFFLWAFIAQKGVAYPSPTKSQNSKRLWVGLFYLCLGICYLELVFDLTVNWLGLFYLRLKFGSVSVLLAVENGLFAYGSPVQTSTAGSRSVRKKPHPKLFVTPAGVVCVGHFLGDPREPRQSKLQEEPLQIKAFSTIERAVHSPCGALGPVTGPSDPLAGPSVDCLIVG